VTHESKSDQYVLFSGYRLPDDGFLRVLASTRRASCIHIISDMMPAKQTNLGKHIRWIALETVFQMWRATYLIAARARLEALFF
jgi:hypothetical protein